MTKKELNDYGIKISQASKTGLVVIMYDVAIKYLDDALDAYNAKDTDEYRHCIRKARNFVNELSSALDMKYKLASQLFSIYLFINNALVRADIRNDISEIGRIRGMLLKLRDAFDKVSQADESGPVMTDSGQVYAGLTYSKESLNENVYTDGRRGFTV